MRPPTSLPTTARREKPASWSVFGVRSRRRGHESSDGAGSFHGRWLRMEHFAPTSTIHFIAVLRNGRIEHAARDRQAASEGDDGTLPQPSCTRRVKQAALELEQLKF